MSDPMLVPLVLAAIFGLLVLVFFFQRPDLGFLFVLFVRGFSDVYSRGTLLSLNVGLIMMLVTVGIFFVLSRRVRFLNLPAGSLLVLIMLLGLVAIMNSESKITGVYQWVRAASVVVVYALAAYLFRTPERLQRVIDVLAVTFVVPALVGLYQKAFGIGFYEPIGGTIRVSGTFVNPGPYGEFLVLFFAVFLCQALVQSGTRKLVAQAIVVTAGTLIVAIYTRGAWVGALIVVLIVGLLSRRPVLIAVPVAAILIGSMVPSIATRSADVVSGQGSLSARQDLWHSTFPKWLGATENDNSSVSTLLNRLAGTGPGSVESLSGNWAAHNDYLGILIQYGVLGLITFVAMSVALLAFAYRTWRDSADRIMAAIPLSFFAVTLAYLFMRITGNIFGATANELYLWTLAGLTVAVRQIASRRAPDDLVQRETAPSRPDGRRRVAIALQRTPANQRLTGT